MRDESDAPPEYPHNDHRLMDRKGKPDLVARSATAVQLLLPGAEDSPQLHLRSWVGGGHVTIDLSCSQMGERRIVELPCRIGGPITVRSRTDPSTTDRRVDWAMAPWNAMNDIFYLLRCWTFDVLLGREIAMFVSPARVLKRASETLRPVHIALRSLRDAALRACDPSALRLARRFDPQDRYRIYRWIVADRSGRVGQAARVVPGALAFAAALHRRPDGVGRAVARRLLRDIVEGRALDRVLDRAIGEWLRLHVQWYEETYEAPLTHLVTRASAAGICARKRLLIRRASSSVSSWDLWELPPPVLVPEEIPLAVRANQHWFAIMHHGMTRNLTQTDVRCHGVFRFLSKNASIVDYVTAGRVIDFVAMSSRSLTASSSPRKALREVAAWHDARERLENRLLPHGGTLSSRYETVEQVLATTFPPAPFAGFRDGTFSIRPIETAGELLGEGRRRAHCVGDLLDRVALGRSAVYQVEVDDERLTLALERTSDSWEITECKGFANAEPSDMAMRTLRRYVAAALSSPSADSPS
jgi:hypothetical protein